MRIGTLRIRVGAILTALTIGLAIPFGPVWANAEEAAAYYENALERFEKEDYQGAVLQLKNVLQRDPKHRSALVTLGEVYLKVGLPAAAVIQLNKAQELRADPALTVLPLARAYLALREFDKLVLELGYQGTRADIQYELLNLKGQALAELQRFDRSIDMFKEAVAVDPTRAEAVAGQALALLRKRDLPNAQAKALEATKIDPENPEAWVARANISHAAGDFKAAIEQYSKVLDLRELHLPARAARAGLYVETEQDERAQKDLTYLRTNFPYDPRGPYLQSVVLTRNGDTHGAKAALSETMQLLSAVPPLEMRGRPQLLMLGGVAAFTLRDYEQAEKYLDRFRERRPEDLGARRLLGFVYDARGWTEPVIDMLVPVLERAPNDVRAMHTLAKAYARAERHDEATVLFERALTIKPNDPDIASDLAKNRIASGSPAQAMKILEAVIEVHPGHPRAGILLTTLALRDKQFAKAKKVAQSLFEKNPDNFQILNLYGTALLTVGELEEGRRFFEKITRTHPNYVPAKINLGKIDLMAGRPAQAVARYLKILESQPEHTGTMLELAKVADSQNEPKQAIHWLEKALSVDGKMPNAASMLVDVLLRSGNKKKALRVAKDAELWAPENEQVLTALATAFVAVKRRDRAVAIYQALAAKAGFDTERLIRISDRQLATGAVEDAAYSLQKAIQGQPEHIQARVKLVEVNLSLGRMEAAEEIAKALQADAPENAASHGIAAEVYSRLNRHEEARGAFEKALELSGSEMAAIKVFEARRRAGAPEASTWLLDWVDKNPTHHRARRALAEHYFRSGALVKARREYELLLQVRPDDPHILNNLSLLMHRSGDQQAAAFAEQAYKLAPDDPAINDTLGWLLVKGGNPEHGLRYLRNAHSRASENPEIRYHLAVALNELGRKKEARKQLKVALSAKRNFPGIEDAKRLQTKLGR